MKKYFVLLLLLILPTFSYMARDGIYTMHDPHLFRQYEIDRCAQEWTFPCRWAPDSGKGYGVPMFNFYGQTVYWLAQSFHLLGMPLLSSIKVVFSLSLILSAVTMFWVARYYFSAKAAMLVSLFYVYAPYRALDVWVRGAINEAWGFVLFPLIFLGLDRFLLTNKYKYIFILIAATSGLIVTHNLSFLMLIPFLGLWTVFRLWQKFSIHLVLDLISAGLVILLLSSWYILPVIFESSLTMVGEISQGYYYFKNHYASLKQLFISNFWGYGGSTWGPNDTISFAIGYLHWLVPLAILALSKFKNTKLIVFIALGTFALFLTHGKSEFIWEIFKPMEYIQFPWRFLGLAVMFLSLAVGYANQKFIWILVSVLIIANAGKFVPGEWLDIDDAGYFSGTTWENGRAASITDFWPKGSTLPDNFAPSAPEIVIGEGTLQQFKHGAHSQQANINIQSNQAKVVFPTIYFPGWEMYIDNQKTKLQTHSSLKLISTWINKGERKIELKFVDTPPRKIGNLVSLITLVALVTWRLKYVAT